MFFGLWWPERILAHKRTTCKLQRNRPSVNTGSKARTIRQLLLVVGGVFYYFNLKHTYKQLQIEKRCCLHYFATQTVPFCGPNPEVESDFLFVEGQFQGNYCVIFTAIRPNEWCVRVCACMCVTTYVCASTACLTCGCMITRFTHSV